MIHGNIFDAETIIEDVRASGCLGQSQRQMKLFEFLLTESLNQRHLAISQYMIAVDILDRSEDFDPTTDSIVRVEMHRLRSNLKNYNATPSNYDLQIPRASYQIIVQEKKVVPKIGAPKTRAKKFAFFSIIGGALFIAGFATPTVFRMMITGNTPSQCATNRPNVFTENIGTNSDMQRYTDRAIRSTLSQHTSLNYIEQPTNCDGAYAPSFTLEYLVLENSTDLNVSLSLSSNYPTSQISFDQISRPLNGPTEDLYFDIVKSVNEVVKPYGTIARKALTKEWGSEVARDNFRCLIQMYDSFDSDKAEDYESALDCLEISINSGLAPLDNYGGLAAAYLEQVRAKREITSEAPLKAAISIFGHVGDDWVNSAEMIMARMSYEAQKEDYIVGELGNILSIAEAKYNAHAIVMMSAAIHYGFNLGHWDKAKSISDQVKRLLKDRDDSIYVIDAAYALMHNTPENSFETCLKSYSKYSVVSNLIVGACAKKAGNIEWVEKTNNNLEEFGIKTREDKLRIVRLRNFEPVISSYLVGDIPRKTELATAQ